ncbi:MAG: TonB-dependent receptor [Chitinophagaceae bacterium]|jgi:outer membrane receptor for ferrienterochelin and colicins|nr:TonB-dependent receptor [Chitinophagaceae bacterium]
MRTCFILLFSLIFINVAAQQKPVDTMFDRQLEEVVVTATRSERKLSNVTVPTTLIAQKTIRQSGSLRLHDILGEQTGLFITQSFGRGVQMQGLSPDYTLILLNGEPLIGRTGGVLDLSRVAVGNIRRIEIVKGPSSSLYGSEALGGVINIITDQATGRKLQADLRYGRFQTIDASLNGTIRSGKLTAGGFVNHNSSQGYSLKPNSLTKTVEPFWRFTGQGNLAYQFNENSRFNLDLRYAKEQIQNSIAVQNLGTVVVSKGRETNQDLNILPSYSYRFNQRLKTSFRGYLSQFRSQQALEVKNLVQGYDDQFRQDFYRIENQTDIHISEKLETNVGGGFIKEYVASNRYDSLSTRRANQVGYVFFQQEWRPVERLTLIAGLRFDANQAYASVWSPKLSLQYRINESWSLTGSAGRGFKAPDFRQLYLNFTNVAAGSYSVFGSLVAKDEVLALQSAGQIDQLMPAFEKLADLKPETSTGLNAGIQYRYGSSGRVQLNIFRNDISNLILTDIIAFKTNGGQIFSYLNISEAFTQGFDVEAGWKFWKYLDVSGGYQFLSTADKAVLEQIDAGQVFKRDEQTGVSSRLTRSDYAGLPGRSKHMANLKFFYNPSSEKWFASARIVYRSGWGTTDLDGNGIINRDDEFAEGFALVNISGGYTVLPGLRVMAGIDNLFNYTDEVNLPGQPGINPYITLSADFGKIRNRSKTK